MATLFIVLLSGDYLGEDSGGVGFGDGLAPGDAGAGVEGAPLSGGFVVGPGAAGGRIPCPLVSGIGLFAVRVSSLMPKSNIPTTTTIATPPITQSITLLDALDALSSMRRKSSELYRGSRRGSLSG